MRVVLIHGMGRTPLTMVPLALRLRAAGLTPELFGYSATFQDLATTQRRLIARIEGPRQNQSYMLVGHSLGGVLARSVLPRLTAAPQALYLLASPTSACRSARYFAPHRWFRAVNGQMGQLLADPNFMQSIPYPAVPTIIYAGDAGCRGCWPLHYDEPNDGLVAVAETAIPHVLPHIIPWRHTFIMYANAIADDIIQRAQNCLEMGALDAVRNGLGAVGSRKS